MRISCDRATGSIGRCRRSGLVRGPLNSLGSIGLALVLVGLTLALGVALPTQAGAQPASCNGALQIGYTSGVSFAIPGPTANADNTYRVELTLGAGQIQNGTAMLISGVNFGLDCTQGTVGNIPCTSDTNKISFLGNVGNIAAGCQNANGEAVNVVTTHAAPSATPNEVAFTFTVNGGPEQREPDFRQCPSQYSDLLVPVRCPGAGG